mmetsp:Transcript_42065/g.127079  ORF Transcript_42065/g.127079 Transcript_42065/m.127079 type:complete len:219 (-) Transcript_42065:634-1290(-)
MSASLSARPCRCSAKASNARSHCRLWVRMSTAAASMLLSGYSRRPRSSDSIESACSQGTSLGVAHNKSSHVLPSGSSAASHASGELANANCLRNASSATSLAPASQHTRDTSCISSTRGTSECLRISPSRSSECNQFLCEAQARKASPQFIASGATSLLRHSAIICNTHGQGIFCVSVRIGEETCVSIHPCLNSNKTSKTVRHWPRTAPSRTIAPTSS